MSTSEKSSKHSFNSLWSCWYGIIATIIQVYIVSKSIERFTAYISLSWPKNDPPYEILHAYIALIGLGVVFLPLFLVCILMKIGNKANDGEKIDTAKSNTSSSSPSLFRWLYRHFLPLGAFIHALSALCFLLPRVLMEAQLIKHGFMSKSNMIKTDLDFFFDHIQDGRLEILSFLQPANVTERKWFQEMDLEGNPDSGVFIPQFVEKLGIKPGHLSLEMVNFAIALIVIAIRYPSVFWTKNKMFGAVFSFQLLLSSFVTLITFASSSILYKIHVVRPQAYFLRSPNKFALNINQTVFMSFGVMIMVLTSGVLLYFYGHRKYCEWKESQDRIMYRCKPGSITSPSSYRNKWWTFFPHFMAFASLVLTAASALPLMYDLVLIYSHSLDSAPLVGASSLGLFLLQNIILWLFLTLKHAWNFGSAPSISEDLPYGLMFSRNPSQSPLGLTDRTTRAESGYAPSESESKYTIPAFLSRSSIRNKAVSSMALTDRSNNEENFYIRNLDNESQVDRMSRRNSCYFKAAVGNNTTNCFDDQAEEAPRVPRRTRRRESVAREERTFAPSMEPSRFNGDYELLIENPPTSPYGTVMYDDIYGIRSLFSPTGFTTLHEVSVESDSSSGVHSDSSPDTSISGMQRTRSSENLQQEIKRVQNRATSFRTTTHPRRESYISNVRNSTFDNRFAQIQGSNPTEVPPPMKEISSLPLEDLYSSVKRPTQMTSFAEPQPRTEEFPPPPEDDTMSNQLISSLPVFRTERFRSESEFAVQIQKHFLQPQQH